MRIIFGIGNRGKRYERTRHNVGFYVLDKFAEKHKLELTSSYLDFIYAGGMLNASPFFLVKPENFVNLSGQAAFQALDKFNISSEDFLVVTDDVNLQLGNIRIRKSGGDGGHNGLHSIIYNLNTESFPRIRIGIGDQFEDGKMADYVLSKFSKKELLIVNNVCSNVIDLIEQFIIGGTGQMLNYFSKISQINKESSGN
ncbi:MAG: aminoacyl-tRNA hydrolase [Melioribacteraceae bacterium]|nr:aminoacyl-tRNA hydrolase [Melioribacteraceae bacterium]MCF8354950.1 aminoacyl-tRNA hydrolase [Melioribacteraceae bacterium]MCF8392361.1 aminoacyl-tRNA hydrolase [Melioribacteraceae bacterium]MCF8417881.1 aminoacyl-tRNA hydrolase [Melioribacteraceae bacterium]